MILLSNDNDPTNIAQYFGGLGTRVPLQYGDFAWFGKWWDGSEVSMCGERKRVGDLVSSLLSGRLAHQIHRAREVHKVIYVFAEGDWSINQEGLLCAGKHVVQPGVDYRTIDNMLNTIEQVEGVHVKRSLTPHETARQVINLYYWWQKPPTEHVSTLDKPDRTVPVVGRMPLVQLVACDLPGVGWKLGKRVGEKFTTVRAMINATMDEWVAIDGIGKQKAETIVAAIGG